MVSFLPDPSVNVVGTDLLFAVRIGQTPAAGATLMVVGLFSVQAENGKIAASDIANRVGRKRPKTGNAAI